MIDMSVFIKFLLICWLSCICLSCNAPSEKSVPESSNNKQKNSKSTQQNPANYDFALEYIKKKLYPDSFDKMSEKDKRYDIAVLDLNDDGKKETLFSMFNSDYCGSGGCTLFLLNHAGEFRGKVTVMDFPVGISKNKTNGWRDLFVKSKNQHVVLQFGEGEYTTNASMAKKVSLEERKASVTMEVLTKFAR